MAEKTTRVLSLTFAYYVTPFLLLTGYMVTRGVSDWRLFILDLVLAAVAFACGVLVADRRSLFSGILLTGLVHSTLRMGPILLSTIRDERIPLMMGVVAMIIGFLVSAASFWIAMKLSKIELAGNKR